MSNSAKIDFTMQELLQSGAHFGHVREKYNPKMAPFIFGLREGVHLIDLEKTVYALKAALSYMASEKEAGKKFLFVCTKEGINDLVKACAFETGMPYITYRWPGGMLTNFETIKKQIKKLVDLEKKTESEEWEAMSKKDKAKVNNEIAKLLKDFGGVKDLTKLPDGLFIVDLVNEKTAVAEARKLKLPIVAIVDTNSNPGLVDYPIPANDDAKKAVELILGEVKKALT